MSDGALDGGLAASPSASLAGDLGAGPGGPARWRPGAVVLGRALVVVLPAWVVARLIVVAALAFARASAATIRPNDPGALRRVHEGLLSWDGAWYQSIASHGYISSGRESLRFFPLFPLLGRMFGRLPGISTGLALVVVANCSALLAMAGLWILVRSDFGDTRMARRSVWLLALAPSAYSLVLAYSDATLLLCSVVTFLGARTGRWWWAALAGLGAGAVRPVGLLLVVPVAIEVWEGRGEVNGRAAWSARGCALAAPVIGATAYLVWVGNRFGDPWLPLSVQQQNGHRGQFAAPVTAMWHDVMNVLHGHHLGSALHVPWALLCVFLLVVAWKRLPRSYTLFALAVLFVSLSSTNLDSFERYALGAFPLVVAASMYTVSRRVEIGVLLGSGLCMAGYASLAFLGMVVP